MTEVSYDSLEVLPFSDTLLGETVGFSDGGWGDKGIVTRWRRREHRAISCCGIEQARVTASATYGQERGAAGLKGGGDRRAVHRYQKTSTTCNAGGCTSFLRNPLPQRPVALAPGRLADSAKEAP